MQKLVFVNGAGTQIDLTAGNFGITNWEGLSDVPLNIQTQQVPFEDGAVYLDSLMEQREISVTVAIYDGNNLSLRYEKKRELISALNPKLGEGVLIYTNDYLSRQIHAIPQIPLFRNKNSNDSGTLKASVAFTCPNPYWEDVEETSVYFDVSKLPILKNNGDVPTSVKVEFFTQAVVNPTLSNMTTNKKISYKGTLNNNLFINTGAGQKKVYTESFDFRTSSFGSSAKSICFVPKLFSYFAITRDSNNKRLNIMKSYDAIKWEVVFSLPSSNYVYGGQFTKIIYDETNDLIIALCDSLIYTSQNGNTWISYNVQYLVEDIVCCGSYYVLTTSNSGAILKCTDFNELTRMSSLGVDIYHIIYANSYFYIIAESMTVYKSSDLINWTSQTIDVGIGTELTDINYNDTLDMFIMTTDKDILTSVDGSSWTVSYSTSDINIKDDGIFSQGTTILVTTVSDGVLLSNNGIDWSYILTNVYPIFSIVYNSIGKLYLCCAMTKFLYSYDLNTWFSNEINNQNFCSITFGKGKYLLASPSYIGISEDENFVIEPVDDYIETVKYIKELDFYFILSSDYGVKYSRDLENWSSFINSDSDRLYDIVYDDTLGEVLIIGEGRNGGILYKTADCLTWSVSNLDLYYYGIAYDKHNNILIGTSLYTTNIYKSTDGGETWATIVGVQPVKPRKVIYCEDYNMFYAVGENGIIKSSDGENWVLVKSIIGGIVNNIIYSEETKMLVAVGTGGDVFISYDGNSFNEMNIGVNVSLSSVAYGQEKNLFIMCGEQGTVAYVNWINDENQIQNITEDSDMNLSLELGENKFRIYYDSGSFACRIVYRQKYIGV